MRFIKTKFNEFKSIFETDDILKENESHANIVTATTMFNLFLVVLLGWILKKLNVVNSDTINMTYAVINSFIGLFIPAIICFVLKGKGEWIKYMLISMFILILVTIDNNLTYTTAFLMVIPVILSARYYTKKFTILTSIFNFLAFLILSIFVGKNYIINYQAIISALLLYYVVVFASTQIAQSGKKMIEKQKEITEKGTRIETEINLAYAIQKSMLPSVFPPFPERDEFDIYASMIPAKEIGGDFYDIFLIDDNHLAFCVADVSGKGVPASLVMMISKIMIKNVTKVDHEVDKAFSRINNMLCDGNDTGTFVTCWLGVLDLKTGKLQYVNAGHNQPLLFKKKDNNFEYLKSNSNLVLAGKEGFKYSSQEINLEPGDKLFLYTDGVVESNNSKKQFYGEERLQEYLNNNKSLTVEETIKRVKEDIDNFKEKAEQFDDITMLEILFKKKMDDKISVAKNFVAEEKELPKVQKFITEELEKAKCDKETINKINLAIEEVFINIAKYAYGKDKGNCIVRIKHDKNKNYEFTFEDKGIKFNPLEVEEPDTSLSSNERKIGGLGIYITKKIMDKVDYKYEEKKNILTISKKI